MKSNLEQAREFRKAYDVRNSKDMQTRTMQKTLIEEEFNEFIEANGQLWRDSYEPHVDTLKELADLVYVCYQFAENMQWDLDEALRRVHESNMSKLGEDGKPIRRDDGKILKGKNYTPPILNDLV